MPVRSRPERNAHRSGQAWSLTTVRAILANPRYTGRQVWNRQPTAMDLIDPGNTGLGHKQVQRRGLPDGWVISARTAHPALVSEADFIAVQSNHAARESTDSGRRYRLAGLLRCGICGRRAESCWSNGRAAYRCRHGHSSASALDPARPRTCTSARTASCRTCPPCASCWPERNPPPGGEGAAPAAEPTPHARPANRT